MNFRAKTVFATVAVLFLLFSLGLGVRRVVLEKQYQILGGDFPFTLESAIEYRRIKMIHDTGRVPAVDPGIAFPEGVDTRKTYEFGSEYVQAFLVKALPDVWSVTDRLRLVESAWFCLGIPLMALWIFWLAGSRVGGLVSALLYAVMISSVIRSTGQELSKENFALPLLLGHLALDARARRFGDRLSLIGQALFLGAALWSWDLIQYYVYLRAAMVACRTWRGSLDGASMRVDAGQAVAVIAVGMLSPYYRAHGLLYSPIALLIYGVFASRFVPPTRGWRGAAILLPAVVAPVLLWISGYGESYSHFGGLLWAKIRHLNHKPADPASLTFEQRIMWVPALHSATMALTIRLLPAILPASLIAAAVMIYRRRSPETVQLCLYYVVSLIAFCFFVRFHVFVSMFAAAMVGGAVVTSWDRPGGKTWILAAVAAVTFVVEAGNTLYRPERWGRSNVYYRELNELGAWLKEHAAPEAVLANFGVSGSIAAYGKCPIVLHPKFETAQARRKVREYGELLFKGDEKSFRDWADQQGAEYYVYAKGEFSSQSPELQMRYFVNAMNPAEDAPARLFELHPERLKWFRPVWSNVKYSVFKIFTKADEVLSDQHARQARRALQQGDVDRAAQEGWEAVKLNPQQAEALDVLRHAESLRSQGFQQDGNRVR